MEKFVRVSLVVGQNDHPTAEIDGEQVLVCPDGASDVLLAFGVTDLARWLREVQGVSGLPAIAESP